MVVGGEPSGSTPGAGSRVGPGLGIWILLGASVAYAVALLGVGKLEAFVGDNVIGPNGRVRLMRALLVGALTGALIAWQLERRAKESGTDALAGGRLLLPLALAGPGVALLASSTLGLFGRIVLMAAFVLTLESALRAALRELAQGKSRLFIAIRARLHAFRERVAHAKLVRLPALDAAAYAAVLGYAVYTAYFTVLRHHHFQTMSNDLGQYDNFFFNALHGRPFQSNPLFVGGPWSALRSHAEFSMYVLLPFYALHPHAETLLVLQSLLVGSAGIPIYLFARRRISRGVALVLCLAYLAYAPLHGASFYDVHFQPIGAAFALWALALFDARRLAPGVIAFGLALASREDVPLVFVTVGAFLVLRGHAPRVGFALAAVSAAYFVLMKFVVMPSVGSWRYEHIYKELFPQGQESYGGVVKTLLSNPVFVLDTLVTEKKVVYALQILTPLAFLPLRGRWLWLSVVPGSVITLLTTAYAPTVEIAFQYSAYLVALIFPAAVLALEELGKRGPSERYAAVGALIAGTVLTTSAWGAFPPRSEFTAGFSKVDFGPLSAAERRKRSDLRLLASRVPLEASLAVSEHELPHVSGREKCFDLKDATFDADYLLYDKSSGVNGADQATPALKRGEYEPHEERGALRLLKRKVEPAKRAPNQALASSGD
jgi:uncharacterized membrane protein